MITAEQLKDVLERADALHRYLEIDKKKIEFEEEDLRTQAPDFWDDPKRAEEQMKKVKAIKSWIDGYNEVRTFAEDCFAMTPENLRAAITPKTKALIMPYPNNPTGGVMTREQLMDIAHVLEETDIVVISDEIYSELVYGGHEHTAFASISGMRERTITLNGFSKAFAMTGWRVGYACAPRELMAPMFKIHQFTMLCASMQGQVAADRALGRAFETGFEDVRMMVRSYDRRRRLMVENFNDMGLSCFEPRGAFYVFPSIKSTGLTSDEFCTRLLEKKQVACVPGTAFGACGEGHIRCSYATSLENLTEALKRIREFVGELG